MDAETTLLPVARPRPPWLAGVAVLLVLALLIGGAALLASRSGRGRDLADASGGPLAAGSRSAGSSGSASDGSPGSPPGAAASLGAPATSAVASTVRATSSGAASSGGRPSPTTPVRSASPTGTGAGLTVAFGKSDSWRDGYQALYTITNRGTAAVQGWTVAVTFSGSGGFQVWDADAKTGTNHQIIFTAKSYNSTVPAGGSVAFGLIVTGSPPPNPTACTVNGRAC
jgi:cytoskeletal protein RodZ